MDDKDWISMPEWVLVVLVVGLIVLLVLFIIACMIAHNWANAWAGEVDGNYQLRDDRRKLRRRAERAELEAAELRVWANSMTFREFVEYRLQRRTGGSK